MPRPTGVKLIAQNRNARREYELLDALEAGLALTGSEVKSLRAGKVSFKEGYVRFAEGQAWLCGVYIAPYENAGYAQHEPDRERRLLLHREEIARMAAKVEQKGLTVVPVRMYFKNGRAKVEIALARGRKLHDKREDLKARMAERDTARELARFK
ncbi:MAG: SsrA-binding protein SmpB [Thermodesulfobacteriota bacterium]